MIRRDLIGWLQASRWHYCFRLPCDVLLQGASKYPRRVGDLYPPLGEARLYRQVRLGADHVYRCNLVLATVQGAKESWAVVTDEPTSLQTLWQYALRFQIEALFLDSKPGAFELEDSRLRCASRLGTALPRCRAGSALRHHAGHGCANRGLAPTGGPALAAWH